MTIEVANESGVGVNEIDLVSVARYVLDRMRINSLAELSILLVDVPAMTELHVKWMDEPGPTDVLSFPMDELDTARRPDEAGRPTRPGRPVIHWTTNCIC
jgi:probable rRNA maturation factor